MIRIFILTVSVLLAGPSFAKERPFSHSDFKKELRRKAKSLRSVIGKCQDPRMVDIDRKYTLLSENGKHPKLSDQELKQEFLELSQPLSEESRGAGLRIVSVLKERSESCLEIPFYKGVVALYETTSSKHYPFSPQDIYEVYHELKQNYEKWADEAYLAESGQVTREIEGVKLTLLSTGEVLLNTKKSLGTGAEKAVFSGLKLFPQGRKTHQTEGVALAAPRKLVSLGGGFSPDSSEVQAIRSIEYKLAKLEKEGKRIDGLVRTQVLPISGAEGGFGGFVLLQDEQDHDLNGYWKKYFPKSEVDRVRNLSDIAYGLLNVHRLGLVHSDVKPANVFAKDHKLSIADFGMAFDPEIESPHGGTPGYWPPEFEKLNYPKELDDIEDPTSRVRFAQGIDVFSWGVTALQSYPSLKNYFPFYDECPGGLRRCELNRPYSKEVLKRTRDVCDTRSQHECLAKIAYDAIHPDPLKRPTMQEIYDRLQIDRPQE